MSYDRFEELLKQLIGLDVRSIGRTAVSGAVDGRVRASGAAGVDAYWELVRRDGDELQALVEAVVVPETWFFRDREAFTAAAAILAARWQRRPHDRLRLLSLPCSTGEEPYTLAMVLLDAGLPPDLFRIEAIDVSEQVLARARTGVYGRNSFRGADLAFRDRHFTPAASGYRISDAVRARVDFRAGNLFSPTHLADREFDVIFCRNLLIYFDADDQRKAACLLGDLLAPDGVLFVGHSEASLLLNEGFKPLRIPQAFAFRRKDSAASAPAASALPPARPVAPAKTAFSRQASVPSRPSPTKPSPGRAAAAGPNALDEIRAMADGGDLTRALERGAVMLRQAPPTADALHLLAVISESAGDATKAAGYYRKAHYLEPNHHEALTHLALLLDRLGDAAGAARMRLRARRLQSRETV